MWRRCFIKEQRTMSYTNKQPRKLNQLEGENILYKTTMKTANGYKILLACIATVYLAKAQSVNDLCTVQNMASGANYFKHPTDCDKFVQCHLDATGRLVGETQQCAFSTYWSTDYLTCLPAQELMCFNDKCAGQPDGLIRGAEGNCRGFWECSNGKSEPKCCPLVQKFDDILGCIDIEHEDDECKDSCFNDVYDISNDTVAAACEKKAVVGEPDVYVQEIAGWGLQKLPCALGTVFDQDTCECVQVKKPVQKAICRPEIYLPFTSDHRDMSGKGHYVGNKNVLVQNGVAYFNGVNSRLVIPRFNNIEHSKTVVIKVNYTSNQVQAANSQALISNSGCGILPSIIISEDDQAVTFGVATTNNLMATTLVSQPLETLPAEKIVEYKFVNGVLTGSVNAESSAVVAEGFMRNVQCALTVGYAENMMYFKGEINEISVYLCDPDMQ